jgi:7,8-dihydropterin-6-yl-methyl-4-(beta-D-ribofuranosyl)aminobenzene 5'-phosphate synthase
MVKLVEPNYQFGSLKEVDGLEIISLIDSSVDFLSTIGREEVKQVRRWVKERKGRKWMKENFRLPIAEHGLSFLIRLFLDGKPRSILFDTGGSSEGVVTNASRMGINLSDVEIIVLSHGHYDHFGGLVSVLGKIDRADLHIIVHEDMFKIRGSVEADKTIRRYPNFPTQKEINPARYIKTKQPHLLLEDRLLVTGEIPRKTSFEKGYLKHRIFINGEWRPDPWIWDDRGIVFNVKKKGLVVISGCAHAGIINTIMYAQEITGVNEVYAIMGGFHMSGKEGESKIDDTVKQFKQLNPKIIVPSHCTGWRSICAIAQSMPQAFVWGSVGNLYQL